MQSAHGHRPRLKEDARLARSLLLGVWAGEMSNPESPLAVWAKQRLKFARTRFGPRPPWIDRLILSDVVQGQHVIAWPKQRGRTTVHTAREASIYEDRRPSKGGHRRRDATACRPPLSLIHISEPTRLGMI